MVFGWLEVLLLMLLILGGFCYLLVIIFGFVGFVICDLLVIVFGLFVSFGHVMVSVC